jgi:7,8-dihydropterin-6-yl-methyl-4-(beta-D-ribofuranosyl)aminobenzene 5'-phosphate synthase
MKAEKQILIPSARRILAFLLTGLGGLTATALSGLFMSYALGRRKAARFYERPGRPRDDGIRLDVGAVQTLRVLPLIDWYAVRDELKTENGVSYLIHADETMILFDLGLNLRREAEPPLLYNLARLGVDVADIDFVVISHPHLDHLGGLQNQMAHKAIVRDQNDPLAGKPVYSTVPLKVTDGASTIVEGPRLLAPGVGTTGPLPVELFILGYTLEQALVVNVAGKGLVVIVGCGHPGIEAIIERAEQVFQTPVYGVIGGLPYPVTDDRAKIGPIKGQKLFGCPNPPWRPIDRKTVHRAIAYLKSKGVQLVSISAHDSCDWSLQAFAAAFGEQYRPLRVGEEIEIEGGLGRRVSRVPSNGRFAQWEERL